MTLSELLQNDRFAQAAGVEILDIRPGYAKARMEVTRRISTQPESVRRCPFHVGRPCFCRSSQQLRTVTLSLSANITFLKAVSSGWLYAEAREIHHHPRIPYIEVRICQEKGDLVAILNSTGLPEERRITYQQSIRYGTTMKILLIEDEEELRNTVREYLTREKIHRGVCGRLCFCHGKK